MGTRIGSHDHVTMVRGRKRARGVFSCGSFSQCFMSTWLLSQTISPNQVPIINAVFEGSGGGGKTTSRRILVYSIVRKRENLESSHSFSDTSKTIIQDGILYKGHPYTSTLDTVEESMAIR